MADCPLTLVLMARAPVPGLVKTRLVRAGGLDAAVAAEVARAMLQCVACRLAARGNLVLAVTPDGAGRALALEVGVGGARVVDQGGGDLGHRLERVWRQVGGAAAFFGIDSPDVPATALDAIAPALADADAAIGPTADGGYWTLAGRQVLPHLLRGIDWGSCRVYHQTLSKAACSGVVIRRLPDWPDVDEPADLTALRRRLAAPSPVCEEPLRRLRQRLLALCGPEPETSISGQHHA